MNTKPLYIILPIVCIAVLFSTCTPSVSGVETTNGFTVVATSEAIEGTAPSYSRVFIFDTAYVPFLDLGTGFGTSVDLDGRFNFPVTPGTYNILVVLQDGSEVGLLRKTVESDLRGAQSQEPEMNHLEKTGGITGSVSANQQNQIIVYITGTGYYRVLSGSTSFSFPSVPPGLVEVRCAILSRNQDGSAVSFEIIENRTVDIESGVVREIGEIRIN